MEKFHAKKLEGIGDSEKRQLINGWILERKMVTINPICQNEPTNSMEAIVYG